MALSDLLVACGAPKPSPLSRAGLVWRRDGVRASREFQRIAQLARRILDLDTIEDLTPAFRRVAAQIVCKTPECSICTHGVRLFPIQSALLWDAERANGLFAPVGVGHGKTLVTFLLPIALSAARTVLLIPPHLRSKTAQNWQDLDAHFTLPEPDSVTIVAYSELSQASKADILDRLAPDLVIADECHNLKHRSAARTKRFLRFFKEHPETRFCGLSGSVTTRSLKDYAHLIELALRKNSPLPLHYPDLMDWSEALDPGPDPLPAGALLQFCNDIERQQADEASSARAGFRRRLTETPGVVATSESAVGCSLTVRPRALDTPSIVVEALNQLSNTWSIGDEEITDAIAFFRYARQMSLGFYYRWAWPDGIKDNEWLDARRGWHRRVRHILRYEARKGLDSPMLVAAAAVRGDLDGDSQVAWIAWAAVKDRPEPPTEAVWLDRFAALDAAEYANERPSLVWCEQSAFGAAVAEILAIPYYGAGSATELRKEAGTRSVVLSIQAHSEGHDHLAVFDRNLITCCPGSGKTWEQLLGRTHRIGQQSDEVLVDLYLHSDAMCKAYLSALESARYIEQTQGNKQKLLFAQRLT